MSDIINLSVETKQQDHQGSKLEKQESVQPTLAVQEIVRISQEKWTCRETGLRRYGCRMELRFRTEVPGNPTKPSDLFTIVFKRQPYYSHSSDVK